MATDRESKNRSAGPGMGMRSRGGRIEGGSHAPRIPYGYA
jgi:hypothetical protein